MTLFEELRRNDVKVTTVNPDLTKTNFFDEFNFEPGDSKNAHLQAKNIAESCFKNHRFWWCCYRYYNKASKTWDKEKIDTKDFTVSLVF